MMKISVQKILERKLNSLVNPLVNLPGGEKIICLTAYTFPVAKILDEYCDIILVGDTLGMTIYGLQNTIEVSLEMMINHGKAVVRAVKKSLVIGKIWIFVQD